MKPEEGLVNKFAPLKRKLAFFAYKSTRIQPQESIVTNNHRIQSRQASNALLTALLATLVSLSPLASSEAAEGRYRIVYQFQGTPDGSYPIAGLTADPQGRLYGTTTGGGAFSNGTAYRLTRPASGIGTWTDEILHSFSPTDGGGSLAPVTLGSDGSVYGTTFEGGSYHRGNVFKLTNAPNWPETGLHDFNLTDGGFVKAALVFGPDGLLYGTTPYSAGFVTQNAGIAFNLSPLGDQVEYKRLHAFGKLGDGAGPVGIAAVPPAYFPGFLGATMYGGGTNQLGTVFALQTGPAGTGIESTLYDFGPVPDVSNPTSSPIIGVGALTHSFLGCGLAGGTHGKGGIYQLTQIGTRALAEKVLYNFGDQPNDPRPFNGQCFIVQGNASGRIYGTTVNGGTADQGAFFELDPPTTQGGNWTEKVDVNFAVSVTLGANPYGIPLRVGNSYYGVLLTTSGNGLVYELTP